MGKVPRVCPAMASAPPTSWMRPEAGARARGKMHGSRLLPCPRLPSAVAISGPRVGVLLLIFLTALACESGGGTLDPIPAAGQTPITCTPNCEGKECGPDGCGGTCGSCVAAAPECKDGLCVTVCTPKCDGLACGPDGCGDVCGTCPGETVCGLDQKSCRQAATDAVCLKVDSTGCCQGVSKNAWCMTDGTVEAFGDCAVFAKYAAMIGEVPKPYCGWTGAIYNCVENPGQVDPTGTHPIECPAL